jgi:hypothetical protein
VPLLSHGLMYAACDLGRQLLLKLLAQIVVMCDRIGEYIGH